MCLNMKEAEFVNVKWNYVMRWELNIYQIVIYSHFMIWHALCVGDNREYDILCFVLCDENWKKMGGTTICNVAILCVVLTMKLN